MKKTTLLLLAFTLSACGFHLKGLGGNTLNIKSLYLLNNQNNNTPTLAFKTLQNRLRSSGVMLINHADQNNYKAIISDYSSKRRQTVIGGNNGDTREIELIDAYHVALFKGKEAIADILISNQTNIEYNANQYIGSQEEETRAHEQLARENADATLRFIQSKTSK